MSAPIQVTFSGKKTSCLSSGRSKLFEMFGLFGLAKGRMA